MRASSSSTGERVVEGQRLTQGANDIMLGWLRTTDVDGVDRHYYVRQLWDAKGSALVEFMNPEALTEYAKICGRTLARAHARAGDSVAIANYLGASDTMDDALARSQSSTPIRTSGTTQPCVKPSTRVGSLPRRASDVPDRPGGRARPDG